MTKFETIVAKYGPRLKKDLSLDDIQCAGIFGNLGGETGGFTLLQEAKPLVKGSRGGFGWMQWTGPRRRKYEAWCSARGYDIAADESNYLYLVHESLTDEKASILALRRTKSVDAAVETFMLKNLRPGIPHLEARKRWGAKAYAVLSKQKTVKQAVKQTSTQAPIIVGTGAAIAVTPPNYWPYIIAGGIVASIIAYIAVRYFRKK